MLRTIATISALAFLLAACGQSTTDRAISGAGIGAGLGAAGSLATGGSAVTAVCSAVPRARRLAA